MFLWIIIIEDVDIFGYHEEYCNADERMESLGAKQVFCEHLRSQDDIVIIISHNS